jgi:DNA-binding NarL/FixJ family response regulator
LAGDAVVAPNVTRRLLDAFADHFPDPSTGRSPTDQRLHQLTDRERLVLVEVARGCSNAEIARLLTVSEATVKTHVGRILTKQAVVCELATVGIVSVAQDRLERRSDVGSRP